DPDRDSGHQPAEGVLHPVSRREPRAGVGQRYCAAGDGCGASTSVGLQYVAVHPDGALAKIESDQGCPQASADQPLYLVGSATGSLTLTRRSFNCGSRKHGILGGEPTRASALPPTRYALFDRGGT